MTIRQVRTSGLQLSKQLLHDAVVFCVEAALLAALLQNSAQRVNAN